MDYILFIQEYYFYLTTLFVFVILAIFLIYRNDDKGIQSIINLIIILFSGWTVFHLGMRSVDIGIDTQNYNYAFDFYSGMNSFVIRKDFFYDYLTFVVAKFGHFSYLLTVCAFIYVFGTYYGLKVFFSKAYFLPFLLFLMSPNFIDFGINVMRSGMGGAVFLIGLSFYYKGKKPWITYFLFILSILFHISFVITFVVFFLTKFLKNTKFLFVCWLVSIGLYLLNVNFLNSIINLLENVSFLNSFVVRSEGYVGAEGGYDNWYHFFMFGLLPIGFAMFNIQKMGYNNYFYVRYTNIYIVIYIFFTILMSTRFAYRIGYLAEFMMPVILLFPLLIEPKIKISYHYLKLTIFIFMLFLIKAFKILIV